jgi:hypothetical protein
VQFEETTGTAPNSFSDFGVTGVQNVRDWAIKTEPIHDTIKIKVLQEDDRSVRSDLQKKDQPSASWAVSHHQADKVIWATYRVADFIVRGIGLFKPSVTQESYQVPRVGTVSILRRPPNVSRTEHNWVLQQVSQRGSAGHLLETVVVARRLRQDQSPRGILGWNQGFGNTHA